MKKLRSIFYVVVSLAALPQAAATVAGIIIFIVIAVSFLLGNG